MHNLNLDALDREVRLLRRSGAPAERLRIRITEDGLARLRAEVPMTPETRGALGPAMFKGVPIYVVRPWNSEVFMEVQVVPSGVPRDFGLDLVKESANV